MSKLWASRSLSNSVLNEVTAELEVTVGVMAELAVTVAVGVTTELEVVTVSAVVATVKVPTWGEPRVKQQTMQL